MEFKGGATWEDPGGGFIKFTVKRALKQDQTLYMEGKLQFILYFNTANDCDSSMNNFELLFPSSTTYYLSTFTEAYS